jgi:hypothetical protein
MTARSARALMWAAIVLLVAGASIGSPEGGLAAATLAFFCAIAPALSGTKRVRVAGILLLLASALMAYSLLPAAKGRMDAYRERAHRVRGAN